MGERARRVGVAPHYTYYAYILYYMSADRERDYYAERPRPTATLEVWKEGRLLEEIDLSTPRTYSVGRAEGSDVLTEHISCSRRHAELRVDAAGGVSLVDLDSAAGTCVGATSLTPQASGPRTL